MSKTIERNPSMVCAARSAMVIAVAVLPTPPFPAKEMTTGARRLRFGVDFASENIASVECAIDNRDGVSSRGANTADGLSIAVDRGAVKTIGWTPRSGGLVGRGVAANTSSTTSTRGGSRSSPPEKTSKVSSMSSPSTGAMTSEVYN